MKTIPCSAAHTRIGQIREWGGGGGAWIHTSLQPLTEIGRIFHDKYILNNKKSFPSWSLENVGLAVPHIHYNLETDIDEIIRRFARLMKMELANIQKLRKADFRAGVEVHKNSRGAIVIEVSFSPTS